MAICTWNWFFYFWLRCFTIYLCTLDMSALHSHECFLFVALSIQLKRFLFLFHIYVKIHFVFYSERSVSLRTHWIFRFFRPKIWIIFEAKCQRWAEQKQKAKKKKQTIHNEANERKIIERACSPCEKFHDTCTSHRPKTRLYATKWIWRLNDRHQQPKNERREMRAKAESDHEWIGNEKGAKKKNSTSTLRIARTKRPKIEWKYLNVNAEK